MKHLHIIAEGKTEEGFVSKVLKPHLAGFGVYVACQLVHTGGTKTHPIKGGLGRVPKYKHISRTLERWVKADGNREGVCYSTMLDLYAFPKDTESPYTEEIRSIQDEYVKIQRLEAAMLEKHQNPGFIPYVQLHEFETLMLANLDHLKVMYPGRKNNIDRLKKEIGEANIELINGDQRTAPSKRIIVATPDYEYQKSVVGPIVAEDIGICVLKRKCRHFNEWVTRLEALGVGN